MDWLLAVKQSSNAAELQYFLCAPQCVKQAIHISTLISDLHGLMKSVCEKANERVAYVLENVQLNALVWVRPSLSIGDL